MDLYTTFHLWCSCQIMNMFFASPALILETILLLELDICRPLFKFLLELSTDTINFSMKCDV
jgi:hypothetical protein